LEAARDSKKNTIKTKGITMITIIKMNIIQHKLTEMQDILKKNMYHRWKHLLMKNKLIHQPPQVIRKTLLNLTLQLVILIFYLLQLQLSQV